jgi:hypothetical protein
MRLEHELAVNAGSKGLLSLFLPCKISLVRAFENIPGSRSSQDIWLRDIPYYYAAIHSPLTMTAAQWIIATVD